MFQERRKIYFQGKLPWLEHAPLAETDYQIAPVPLLRAHLFVRLTRPPVLQNEQRLHIFKLLLDVALCVRKQRLSIIDGHSSARSFIVEARNDSRRMFEVWKLFARALFSIAC